MSQHMGRPRKVPTEEKLAIVDRYYIMTTDESASRFGTHGIFRKLSEYAKSLGCSLEPHDFSRDLAVRERIGSLAAACSQDAHIQTGVPTYEPLDIAALMMTGRENIEKTLKDREAYFQDLHLRAAKAIEHYASLSQLSTQYQSEVTALKNQNSELCAQIDTLSAELKEARKAVGYMKRIIRKNVEPERAQNLLATLTSRDVIIQHAESSVMNSIHVLAKEDLKMRNEAQAESETLELSSLLRRYP